MKIRESCLQTGNFIYKPGISLTKQDFHLQRESLGLQRGFSGYYLPLYPYYIPFFCFGNSFMRQNLIFYIIIYISAIFDKIIHLRLHVNDFLSIPHLSALFQFTFICFHLHHILPQYLLHFLSIRFYHHFQYVIGGHFHRIWIMKSIVQFSFRHGEVSTSPCSLFVHYYENSF